MASHRVSTANLYGVGQSTRRLASTAALYVVHGPNQRRLSTAALYVVTPVAEAAEPPTAGVISATGGLNQITITQVTAPVGATTRQLYVAESPSDLPEGGPGAGAVLIGEWDDELGDWVSV
jgi:hypothetical protein